ncbi:MAG: ATP-binding cassette domain-containing protein [Bradymonadia bacterium]
MIRVRDLTKVYRVPEKDPGLRGALRSLFNRRYKEVRAVDGVAFEIEPGERVAFLGPNGAGKTTTLKMLTGLLAPTAGHIEVLGLDPRGRPVKLLHQITLVMGQKQQLLWDLPPRDTFDLNRALFNIPQNEYDETLGELRELLALDEVMDRPVRNLSLGQRMKCELAAALLHRPKVLFLDEPTIGLDVVMQAQVRRFIAAWNARFDATVMLTSHDMDDIAALCPRVILIDAGKVRYDGPLEDLVRQHAPRRRVVLQLEAPLDAEALGTLTEQDSALRHLEHEGAWRLEADVAPEHVGETVQHALAMAPHGHLTIEDPPLEAVFAELFGE